MDSIVIPWQTGGGNITVSESGGEIIISSDSNAGVERSQTLTFRTLAGDATATLIVVQKGGRVVLRDMNSLALRDSGGKVLTAKKE